MLKYKASYDDLVDLFNRYVATWGGEARTFTFKGYKNGECVIQKELGENNNKESEISKLFISA